MAIQALNNTAMKNNDSIERQNKNTLSKAQLDAGFSNDNYTHTSDRLAANKAAEASKNAGLATNPNAKLGQDAFMRLLLEELRHQDPTSPMDSDKMLTQTSQLAALETQEKTNKTMDMLASRMEILGQSLGIGLLSSIGSIATMNTDGGFEHDGKSVDLKFNLYIPPTLELGEQAGNIHISVLDKYYQEIDQFVVNKDNLKLGNNNFLWDTRYSDGTIREKGEYKFIAKIDDGKGNEITIPSGFFEVEGVTFKDGKPYLTAGDIKIDFNKIKEFKAGYKK